MASIANKHRESGKKTLKKQALIPVNQKSYDEFMMIYHSHSSSLVTSLFQLRFRFMAHPCPTSFLEHHLKGKWQHRSQDKEQVEVAEIAGTQQAEMPCFKPPCFVDSPKITTTTSIYI